MERGSVLLALLVYYDASKPHMHLIARRMDPLARYFIIYSCSSFCAYEE